MENKRNWLGMLVMVLVFGMAVVGCDLFNDGFGEPTGVSVTKLSSSSIHVTWNAVSGAKWYEIAYRTNLDSADTRRSAGSSTITTYTHSWYTSTDVTTLYYYVKAHNKNYTWEEGYKASGWSSPVSVNIK